MKKTATTTYTCNLVNQYTAVNAVVPVYDLDGNMTNYNGWTYTYNGENHLIVTENAAAGVRVEADYDYMGRRIFKKVYNNNTLTKHSVFVYDGFKQIAEFDALNNNSLKANYLWQPVGLDIVLLRNSEYLIADGNKNIIQVRNATGSVTDSYIYDPFGKVTHEGSSENPFQFSSEFFDDETELVYYNYRYYMQNLGRWLNRDPIDEDGGVNLYLLGNNNSIILYDYVGFTPQGSIFFSKYPNYKKFPNRNDVWDYIGGTVKELLYGEYTCAARISVALILSNEPISKGKRQFYNTLKRSETGIKGNYITSAKKMAAYLSYAWGQSSKCSETRAMYFSSNATNINDIRTEILKKLEKKEKGCECRKNFVAVVFSAAPAGSRGLSGHIGVVTESYNDSTTPLSQPSKIWILGDKKK